MKPLLKVLAFPFILFWSLCQTLFSIFKALIAKPFILRIEGDTLEIGIVPMFIIIWLIS